MIDLDSPLAALVSVELDTEAPPPARALAEAIRRERGDVASILFYGSCLRKKTNMGVYDFYVLVDEYRDTYDSTLLAIANRLLPPNVFYIETEFEGEVLRSKYAVLTLRDFERCVQPACIHPYIWARFSQPSLLAYVRDDEARDHAIRCASQAAVTLVQRLMVFLPANDRIQRFSASALWQTAFALTYGAERRVETDERISSNYESAPERYDRAAKLALQMLEDSKWIERASTRGEGAAYEVEMSPMRRKMMQWRWHVSKPISRVLAIGRLLKTAFTFGDWVPYALFKLETHTGQPIVLTQRQREHPLIFAWPVIWKVYLRR